MTVPGEMKIAAPDAAPLGLAALGGLLEESSSILALAISRSGDVVLWNRAAEDFFGVVAGQAMGRSLAKAVGTETARQLRAVMNAGRQGGNVIHAEGRGPSGLRKLTLECLPAKAPAAFLFLATPRPVESTSFQRGRPMVNLKPRRPFSGARRRSPSELQDELQWRSEELETLSEELEGLTEELSAVEAAAERGARVAARSDAMLRRVLDKAARPFILCDPKNLVLLWNHAAVKRYGLSSAQAVGKDLFRLVPALDDRPLRLATGKARKKGTSGSLRLTQKGEQFLVDPFPAPGRGRSYLLRVGTV